MPVDSVVDMIENNPLVEVTTDSGKYSFCAHCFKPLGGAHSRFFVYLPIGENGNSKSHFVGAYGFHDNCLEELGLSSYKERKAS